VRHSAGSRLADTGEVGDVHVTVTGIRGCVETLPRCVLQRCGGVYVRSSEDSSLAAEDETSVRWQAETVMDGP